MKVDMGCVFKDLDLLPNDDAGLKTFLKEKLGTEIFNQVKACRQLAAAGIATAVRDLPDAEIDQRGCTIGVTVSF